MGKESKSETPVLVGVLIGDTELKHPLKKTDGAIVKSESAKPNLLTGGAPTPHERAFVATQIARRMAGSDVLKCQQEEADALSALAYTEVGSTAREAATLKLSQIRARLDYLLGRECRCASEDAAARLALKKSDSKYGDAVALEGLVARVSDFDAKKSARESEELRDARLKLAELSTGNLMSLLAHLVILNAELEFFRAPGSQFCPNYAALSDDDKTAVARAVRGLVERIAEDLSSYVFRLKLAEAGVDGLAGALRTIGGRESGSESPGAKNRRAGVELRARISALERS